MHYVYIILEFISLEDKIRHYLVGEFRLLLDPLDVLLLKRLELILALLDERPLASVYSSCRLDSPTSRSSGVPEEGEEDFSCCFLLLGLFLFLYLKAPLTN